MIVQLSVQNFAIIDFAELHFAKGLTIITGETGAGKSILLGALSLILGERADRSVILNEDKKCIVEGIFTIQQSQFQSFFEQNNLDYDQETIVRRELKPNGKSRAFINDTPVTLAVLKEFSSQVVDLHQQHESLSLTKSAFQREVIDVYAGIEQQVHQYTKRFKYYTSLHQRLANKREKEANQLQEQDFLTFQYEELEKANIQAGELEQLETELHSIQHHEEIQVAMQAIDSLLNEDATGAIDLLKQAHSQLRKLTNYHHQFEEVEERFNSSLIELQDIENELTALQQDTEVDEERVELLTERVNLYNRLLQKHQVQNDEELLEKYKDIESQLNEFTSIGEEIERLEKQVKEEYEQLNEEAKTISDHRIKVKTAFEADAKTLLQQVGMEHAKLILSIKPSEKLHAFGKDEVALLFSANTGQQPQPLKQVASGGELSRLMLVIKTLMAEKAVLPTMIFDEIDAGISGEVAMKVGNLLQQLAASHQIISITHLPQIAAKGQHHLKVFKEDVDNRTRSNVKSLSKSERIQEIAEMLSGQNPSQTSLKAAKELLH